MSGSVTIGIYCDPWAEIRTKANSFRNPLALWRKAVWYKANPRTVDDMRRRLAAICPAAQFIDTQADPHWRDALASAEVVVLVYPDSIGLGYAPLERAARRAATHASFSVVNGRSRHLHFDGRARFALRTRRFLEWTMLPELVAGAVILLATPILLAVDAARGRR